jgi:hypothetical protein
MAGEDDAAGLVPRRGTETPISGLIVLPPPAGGLARFIASVSPPVALSFSTPFVRVPVSLPPEFDRADVDAHLERASSIAAVGWTPTEQQRRNRAIDDRSAPESRYGQLASLHPWLTLTLERAGLRWQAALVLGESLTRPALDWFDVEQAAVNGAALRPFAYSPRLTFDVTKPKERVALKPYRHIVLTVLHDIGADSSAGARSGPAPEHRDERLLWAGKSSDVTQPGVLDPRGARKALTNGRRLLHQLGCWPWVLFSDGALTDGWWREADIAEGLLIWCRVGEVTESLARHRRADALANPAQFLPPLAAPPVDVPLFVEDQRAMSRASYAAGEISVDEHQANVEDLARVAAREATPAHYVAARRIVRRLASPETLDAAA